MSAPTREELCRILHDANTGRITPDDADPTRYGAMADAVLARLALGRTNPADATDTPEETPDA